MLMMTTKIDKKKILIGLVGLILVVLVLFSCNPASEKDDSLETAATSNAQSNDDRVKFLNDLGLDVTTTPIEAMQVRFQKESNDVFDRYNELQRSQGYDLAPYAGKTVMRYVYQVKQGTDESGEIYATLLVYRDQIIGGDITDTSPGGKIQGLNTGSPKANTAGNSTPSA